MSTSPSKLEHITSRELAAQLHSDNPPCVLDVREAWELQLAKLNDTVDIPMAQVPEQLEWLRARQSAQGQDTALVVMCHSGVRSAAIAGFLQQNGFQRVFNLQGGIHAWSESVDQTVPTY